jgi:tripartite-type tricarboxylate transporter receptor subunit TctC
VQVSDGVEHDRDVPTVAESGFPGFQPAGWHGIAAPGNTPAPVLAKLSSAIRCAVADLALNAWIVSQNIEPRTTTPAEYVELSARATLNGAQPSG